jgi:hypothetical protein
VTIAEKALKIDGEVRPRAIISTVGENGVTTFMIDGSSQGLIHRERRAPWRRLLRSCNNSRRPLRPLKVQSESPEPITEGLGMLFNWFAEERERLTAAPRSVAKGGHDVQ